MLADGRTGRPRTIRVAGNRYQCIVRAHFNTKLYSFDSGQTWSWSPLYAFRASTLPPRPALN